MSTSLRLSALSLQREIDDEIHSELLEEARRFVDELAEATTDAGDSLRTVLSADGPDLWEIVRARIGERVRARLYAYFLVERLAQQRRPSEIVVEDPMPEVSDAARFVGRLLSIPVHERTRAPFRDAVGLERWLHPPGTATRLFQRLAPRVSARACNTGAILVAFEYLEELKMILPAVDALLDDGNTDVALCPLDGRERLSSSPLYRRWLRAHPAARHVHPDDVSLRDERGCRLDERALRQIHQRLFLRNGISLRPLIGRQVLAEIDVARVRFVSKRFDRLRSIIGDLRPALGVVTNPYGVMHRCLLAACRERGVPTLLVPHHADQLDDTLRASGCAADHAAVMGPKVEQMLVERGMNPERVHVTGAPWFDAALRARSRLEAHVPSANEGRVTFVAQGLRREGERLRAIARALHGCALTIRPHPKHWAFPYRAFVWKHGFRCAVSRTPDLHRQLAQSDLVVSVHSVAMLEAILLDRPVVALADETLIERPLTLAYGASALAAPDELETVFDRVLRDPAFRRQLAIGRRELLADYFASGGDASSRIASLIVRLAHHDPIRPPHVRETHTKAKSSCDS